MAGHVDLRQHLDVALGGIGDDVGDLLLAVVAAVGTRQSAGRIEAFASREPIAWNGTRTSDTSTGDGVATG